jgi:hypothetical protein
VYRPPAPRLARTAGRRRGSDAHRHAPTPARRQRKRPASTGAPARPDAARAAPVAWGRAPFRPHTSHTHTKTLQTPLFEHTRGHISCILHSIDCRARPHTALIASLSRARTAARTSIYYLLYVEPAPAHARRAATTAAVAAGGDAPPPQQWQSALPHMSFTTPFTGHGTRQGSHSSRSRPTS